jgi:hypothetical protein
MWLGNYLNGNTPRGDAPGFSLEVGVWAKRVMCVVYAACVCVCVSYCNTSPCARDCKQSLGKLSDTKASDNKSTLLTYIVGQIQKQVDWLWCRAYFLFVRDLVHT